MYQVVYGECNTIGYGGDGRVASDNTLSDTAGIHEVANTTYSSLLPSLHSPSNPLPPFSPSLVAGSTP